MKKNLTALCVALSFYCGVSGQKNFLPGYLLNKEKDTIKGLIDYRDWEKNPYKISFKVGPTGEEKSYGVNDIEGFEIYDFDIYKKAVVLLDMSPVDINRIYEREQVADKNDTVFLRFLTQGRDLKIYEFVDQKSHFFMQKGDGPAEELIYKLVIDESSENLRPVRTYVQQIKMKLAETEITVDQATAADRLSYDAGDFKKFFSALDGKARRKKNVTNPTTNKNGKKGHQFFVGAGITQQQLKFSSSNTALNSLGFDRKISYIIAGGVDFLTGRNFSNMVLRLEFSMNEVEAKGSGITKPGSTGANQRNEYLFKQMNFTPTVSFLYKFLGASRARPYLGAGIGYNISSYPKHRLTYNNETTGSVRTDEDFPELEKTWMGLYARAGVIMNDKFEVGLTSQVSGSFINYSGIGEKSRPVSLRFSYRF